MFTELLIASTLLLPAAARAPADTPQTPAPTVVVAGEGEIQELVLRDGTRAFGRVERVDGALILFRTTSGVEIDVAIDQVAELRRARGRVVDGAFRPADPNPTRLFFAPTGRSLRQGDAYLGVYEILLPFVQVGLTDRISIGAGTPLVFGDFSERPFWITPKVQVLATESTQAAVGALHFMNIDDESIGIAYGVVTRGSDDSALSVGVGYAYDQGDDGDGAVLAMIGGEHRITRGMKVVTENYVFRDGGIASVGVRLLRERLSVDLGLVAPLASDGFIVFPMVNFVWAFVRR
jgi:hypothetical protein